MFKLRFLVMLLLISSSLFGLSKEAEIDLIKSQLVESQKKGDSWKIRKLISEWRKIDNNIPISITFWEAKALYNKWDSIYNYSSSSPRIHNNRYYFHDEYFIKPFELLEEYINVAGSSGRFYKEALKLYPKYKQSYIKAKKLKAEKDKRKDKVVIDEVTGLMWQDNYRSAYFISNFLQAKNYCEGSDMKGYSDWKIPTANQFMTILDFSKERALKKEFTLSDTFSGIDYFIEDYKEYYHKNNKKYYNFYTVNTKYGKINHVYGNSKSNYNKYVKCVRKLK